MTQNKNFSRGKSIRYTISNGLLPSQEAVDMRLGIRPIALNTTIRDSRRRK